MDDEEIDRRQGRRGKGVPSEEAEETQKRPYSGNFGLEGLWDKKRS